ncbi:MAG: cytochrome c biogenesis protein CcsA, partial [Candidatus Kapaibacterium sp.]
MSGAAVVSYFISSHGKAEYLKAGRILYKLMAAMIAFASVFLLSNILAHNFQMAYVYEFTSREMPLHLLISAFFSGQEGSFLLWALLLAAIGLVLGPYSRRHGYEPSVMGIYSSILIFMLILLIAKSPFDYIWQAYPEQNIPPDFIPPNGRGLNPVLQNFWVTIHPPILFAGYAMMSVPYAFALAALIKKDFRNWIDISLPWTLAALGVLGLGIIIGGFWAYETLGWGGYWGWDPVENSSLLPWLAGIALSHTMLVQKRTGGLIKTNIFLATLAFSFVIYATFLTRSGILSDVSVHSFIDPGQFVYFMLLLFLSVIFIGGLILLLVRAKHLSGNRIDFPVASREFFLSLGAIIILMSTAIIFIGTSWPILSGIFADKTSSVDISYYDKWNLPLIIGIMLTNAISLYLNWQSDNIRGLRKAMIPLALSAATVIVMYVFGIHSIPFIILGFSAIFSILANLVFAFKKLRKRFSESGGKWSHMGIGLLMIGTIASGAYSESENLRLILGEPQRALDAEFTLTKYEEIEKHLQDREKYEYYVRIVERGDTMFAKPVLYLSDFNQRRSPFLEPGIKRMAFKDIYISPQYAENKLNLPTITVERDSAFAIPGCGERRVVFKGFDMSGEMKSKAGNPMLGAILSVTDDPIDNDTLMAEVDMSTGNLLPVWQTFGCDSMLIALHDFVRADNINNTRGVFAYRKIGEPIPEPVEILGIEAARRPLINLVWLGSILIAF